MNEIQLAAEGKSPESTPLVFAHKELRIAIDPENGRMIDAAFDGEPIMEPGGRSAVVVTLHETGETLAEFHLAACTTDETADGLTVTLALTSPSAEAAGLRISESYNLHGDTGQIDRIVRLSGSSATAVPIQSVALSIDGLTAGDPDNAAISVPMTRFLPGTALRRAARRPRVFPSLEQPNADGDYDFVLSAQDLIAGTVTIGRETPPLTIAVTPAMDDFAVTPRVYGADKRLVIEHEFAAEVWVRAGDTVTVGEQVIHVQPHGWVGSAREVGKLLAGRGLAPPTNRAEWARDAIIYEADPVFHGTISALTAKLGAIQQAGFNTVYIMPWHLGGYGTVDYEVMAPELGALADLRVLTDSAHARGMRVIFDLLLVVAVAKSSYFTEHPDWFYRDADCKPLPHPVWKGPCLDPASPGFRRFLTDYAVRCVNEFGADGFRVDAPAHRGGNWLSTNEGMHPYQHSYAVFTLLDEIRDAMRKVKPDAILLSEIFGPELAKRCDMLCWQWVFFVDWLLAGLQTGQIDGATLQRILGEQILVMPPGTWLTYFTVNHDSKAFVGRLPEGDAERALFATLALLGAGMLDFGGGWGVVERPAGRAAEYAALFAAKAAVGGVGTSDLRFPPSPDPSLFVSERQTDSGRIARIVTNIGPQNRPLPALWQVGAPLYSRLGSLKGSIAGWDTLLLEA